MKNFTYLFVCFACVFFSCEKNDLPGDIQEKLFEEYQVAVPITQSMEDFRTSVVIQEPKEIEQSGKIYMYENYIFINDQMKGILVLDNTTFSPQKIKYIEIPQNTDIAVKGDILYANSGRDLVTFDISDINDIKIMERLENVFYTDYRPEVPPQTEAVDFSNFNDAEEIIIGYTMETREREISNEFYNENASPDVGDAGTGGSMARFNIGGDYLYVVGRSELNVFEISDLSNPQRLSSEYVGWQIETIFNKEGYLYLGSSTGMYIYSIEDPSVPTYVSQIDHVMGCDPVVVENDIAYVTIRGGNTCGQNLNQLEVIDVSDKTNPQLLQVYQMDGPYGLGILKDKLFVCDGTSGLKVYDVTNTPDLVLTDHFQDVNAYDVIPMENVLVMIGENMLRQYSYKGNDINLISTFNLD